MFSNKAPALSTPSFLLLAVLAMAAAAFYRLPLLDERPMHADESILAFKTADLATTGQFQYDPKDYHGPGLHYAASLWSKIAFWGAPDTWRDDQLRAVTAICGLLLILATLFLTDALGRGGVVAAMLLAAISPMQVYYSRYYIMETPLVFLVMITMIGFWRYTQGSGKIWLLVSGIVLGIQHATKETFVLNIAAGLVAWIVVRVLFGPFEPRRSGFSTGGSNRRPAKPLLWVLIPAVLASVAMYSGGFHDWEAVKNSFTTYANYWERSGGAGHEKPWHYYLTLLTWRSEGGLKWSEGLIVGLALIGMAHGLMGNHTKNGPRQAFLLFLSL
ncbi:MAG: phospholipid carrier-dependent glycosyltransferase, partial [Prosthecobacter sp.]